MKFLSTALLWGCSGAPAGFSVNATHGRWVVPGDGLPEALDIDASNNNVSIARHDGRLFMGWRTAPTHFASADTQMHIVSSGDSGTSWDWETTIQMGTDVREPLFYQAGDTLFFSWFEGGTNSLSFEPRQPWRMEYMARGAWSEPEQWGEVGEVPWEVISHEGLLYLTSYLGNHYDLGEQGDVSVRFQVSTDGRTWMPVGAEAEVYRGGASEAAFAFDADGTLWAVLRNEDGDETGFGSLLCRADAASLGTWNCPDTSDPNRYDSPRMFQHDAELYMVARRDIGGPYAMAASDLPFATQQIENLAAYSGRPKTTALYWIDRSQGRVEHLMDLPGAGDTAFPSIVWQEPHRFLIANYSSPLTQPDVTWLEGQTAAQGTGIYLIDLEFQPR